MEPPLNVDAYSYRTSSRFGSRVKISINQGMVTITGPRINRSVYRAWLIAQVILLTLTVLALLAAAAFWDSHYLVAAGILLACHGTVGGFGAGCLWELENLIELSLGIRGKSVCYPVTSVKRVKIGPGWARHGLWLVILPYVWLVNKSSEGHCVSFDAPDGEHAGDCVYALHLRTTEEAGLLAGHLRADPQGTQAVVGSGI